MKASVLHCFGKMTKGLTEVASVAVLKEVKTIQKKGTSIVMETSIKAEWTMIFEIFLFLSKLSIFPPNYK